MKATESYLKPRKLLKTNEKANIEAAIDCLSASLSDFCERSEGLEVLEEKNGSGEGAETPQEPLRSELAPLYFLYGDAYLMQSKR